MNGTNEQPGFQENEKVEGYARRFYVSWWFSAQRAVLGHALRVANLLHASVSLRRASNRSLRR
jgi:hypothetical protein